MTTAKATEGLVEQDERTFAVDSMSRVEGEGRLKVVVRGSEVVQAELSIFEAPRWPWLLRLRAHRLRARFEVDRSGRIVAREAG